MKGPEGSVGGLLSLLSPLPFEDHVFCVSGGQDNRDHLGSGH